MHKTLIEELPSTKEGLDLYIKGVQKELDVREPLVTRLKLALKKAQERRDKWK